MSVLTREGLGHVGVDDRIEFPNMTIDDLENEEHDLYCAVQEYIREHSNVDDGVNCYRVGDGDENTSVLMLFLLPLMILWGVVIRTVIKRYEFQLPYTVILMLSGLLLGVLSKYFCPQVSPYTDIARIQPKVILYTFLPILVFESAFNTPTHVFFKAFWQIMLLAFPGMVISTGFTAVACMYIFPSYDWSFIDAALFGSIISATDPVAVVAILRELGASEILSVTIEGESLLNDGVAVLLYDIFAEMESPEHGDHDNMALNIFLKLLQIAIGGPVFGWCMGKFTIFYLRYVFNDSVAEITTTVIAAYLTYCVGEDVLGVSGILAVVALGIVLASERTVISADSLKTVEHFWEMMGFFANTVLFVIVGIVITETAWSSITWMDGAYLIGLYLILNVIRIVMIYFLSPILDWIGFGLTWKNASIMAWGGLRGAVGICLALEVFQNNDLCSRINMGPKILFQTAGTVLLTLIINATTTKRFMELIGMTSIPKGPAEDMEEAFNELQHIRTRDAHRIKNNRFMADVNVETVLKLTKIHNPYQGKQTVDKNKHKVHSELTLGAQSAQNLNLPTFQKVQALADEMKHKVLKALKVSFWKQHEEGTLKENAVRILLDYCDQFEEKPLETIRISHLRKYWTMKGHDQWLHSKLLLLITLPVETAHAEKTGCRKFFWAVATYKWMDDIVMFIVLLNMVPILWEFGTEFEDPLICHYHHTIFNYVNLGFTVFYVIELIFKIIGYGFSKYWKSKWNKFDVNIVLLGVLDCACMPWTCEGHLALIITAKIFRLTRVFRIVRLIPPLFPVFLQVLEQRENETVFLGFDMLVGFSTAFEDVIRQVEDMEDDYEISTKMREVLESQKLESLRELSIVQKKHPGVAVSVKTRHTSRIVLNKMRQTLTELKLEGAVSDEDTITILGILDMCMKRILDIPSNLPPPKTDISNISWLRGHETLIKHLESVQIIKTFSAGDVLYAIGDEPNGVFLITAGLVLEKYEKNAQVLANAKNYGSLPNSEINAELALGGKMKEYYGTGSVIGEIGVLKPQVRATSVICESFVRLIHIQQEFMLQALKDYNDPIDSLEGRMWRSYGMGIAISLLKRHEGYENVSADKIKKFVYTSAVPITNVKRFDIPDFVLHIVLIEGQVQDSYNNVLFTAPKILPDTCRSFTTVENRGTRITRFLILSRPIA